MKSRSLEAGARRGAGVGKSGSTDRGPRIAKSGSIDRGALIGDGVGNSGSTDRGARA
jgi:hypothetical protein